MFIANIFITYHFTFFLYNLWFLLPYSASMDFFLHQANIFWWSILMSLMIFSLYLKKIFPTGCFKAYHIHLNLWKSISICVKYHWDIERSLLYENDAPISFLPFLWYDYIYISYNGTDPSRHYYIIFYNFKNYKNLRKLREEKLYIYTFCYISYSNKSFFSCCFQDLLAFGVQHFYYDMSEDNFRFILLGIFEFSGYVDYYSLRHLGNFRHKIFKYFPGLFSPLLISPCMFV